MPNKPVKKAPSKTAVLARLYPEHAERTTLYASNADLAVHLSSKLHDAPRAGYYQALHRGPRHRHRGRARL